MPSSASSQSPPEITIISGTSKRTSLAATRSGTSTADSPRMNSTLKMLLPTTLPTAMSA